MKKLLGGLLAGGALLFVGASFADEHEGEKEEANVAAPMEMYACTYNDGKGPADLDKATSLSLQESGVGPGRPLGCGIFLPHKGIRAVGETEDKSHFTGT